MKNIQLKKTGAPSREELQSSFGYPKKEEFLKGPIAVIECVEEIPCNPCETSCPKGAITIGQPITNLPCIDFEKCAGCGICAAACPGLAIYIKDYNHSDTETLITFPFEYLPLPKAGDAVTMTGRMGQEICSGRVIKINNSRANNRTVLVSAVFPKEYFENVVSIKRLPEVEE